MTEPNAGGAQGPEGRAVPLIQGARMADENAPQSPNPQEPGKSAEDMAAEALRSAQEAVAGLGDMNQLADPGGPKEGSPGAAPVSFPDFSATPAPAAGRAIDLLADVNLHVKIELGRTRMLVEDVLQLGEGAVVELDKLAGDPVDVYVNDRHVARGEVLVLNDNFCVRINEIIAPSEQSLPRAQTA